MECFVLEGRKFVRLPEDEIGKSLFPCDILDLTMALLVIRSIASSVQEFNRQIFVSIVYILVIFFIKEKNYN